MKKLLIIVAITTFVFTACGHKADPKYVAKIKENTIKYNKIEKI